MSTDDKSEAMIKGFQQVAQTLKNTLTKVKQNNIAVTVTAEPMVIDIQIETPVDLMTLPNQLKSCLNEAFKASAQKVIEEAYKELENVGS